MLSLAGLQRWLMALYRIDLDVDVDAFVRELHPDDPDAHRGEVVLVRDDTPPEVAVLLDPRVTRALAGAPDATLSRFEAWCMALEGVSHFTMLAWRAAQDREVSVYALELQADIDKFALGLLQPGRPRSADDTCRRSRALRSALFDRAAFHDAHDTVKGQRYRRAHRRAARFVGALERRHLRHGRVAEMVMELRRFYRAGDDARESMIDG